jgi:hypothetical protein
MTPKISLVAAVALTALAVGVPAAFAEGRLAGSQASTLSQPAPIGPSELAPESWMRAERVRRATSDPTTGLGTNPVDGYVDAFERGAPPVGTAYVATTSSDDGIEWPQIGAGFMVGILLALGLGLSVRYVRVRQVAH